MKWNDILKKEDSWVPASFGYTIHQTEGIVDLMESLYEEAKERRKDHPDGARSQFMILKFLQAVLREEKKKYLNKPEEKGWSPEKN